MLFRDGFLAVLAAIVAVTAGQEDLSISPNDVEVVRALGRSVMFTCSVASNDILPNLKWFNQEDQEITQFQGRMYLERVTDQILKLYITGIINQDAGTYTCRGDIEGNPLQKQIALTIFKDITFDHAPSPQNPPINTQALIECVVSGQPRPDVSWRYAGQNIVTGGRYLVEDTGLRIEDITLEDDGDYLCRGEVAVDGRYEEQTIRVEVHIPPTITQEVGELQGIDSQETSLICKAEALPSPKYDFVRMNEDGTEGAPVLDSERVQIDRDGGAIHFRPLIKGDEGGYKCKAHNDVGNAESIGNLFVIVPPKIHTLLNQTGMEGQSQELNCLCDGDPAPKMRFKKVGNADYYEDGDNGNGKVIIDSSVDRQLKMTVMELTPLDTDNYTCDAVNEAGDHKMNGTIIVNYSPRFDSDHKRDFYLWAGKVRNVTCHIQAEPMPTIRWKKDGKELISNETYKIYLMGKNSNLQITCREQYQGWIYGEYTCSAENNVGSGELPLNIHRATLPGAPLGASVREESPTRLILDIQAPEDTGLIPIYGFRVEYDNSMQDYRLDAVVGNGSEPVRIENLRPATQYLFRLRAKNEVGVGNAFDYSHKTLDLRQPYPVVLLPRPAEYAYEYDLVWEAPRTGGLPINYYEFKIRKVSVLPGGRLDKPLEDWVRSERQDDPAHPMTTYRLENLSPSSHYQAQVRAYNDLGYSPINKEFIFKTLEGEDPKPGALSPKGISTGAVIGIVIIIFLVFLVVFDVSCYFMKGCGILMTICVNLCGKPQPASKEKAMEEGESKEALKQPVEDAVVAQEQEVVSEEPPEKEEPVDEPAPPPEEPAEDEKKPLSDEKDPMAELEPEDKEEKQEVIEEQPKDAPEEPAKETVEEEEEEVEVDEKTPLREDPKPNTDADAEPQAPPSDQPQPEQA